MSAMNIVNHLSWEPFMERFGNVVEYAPIVAGAIWTRRPFATRKHLHQALCEFLDELSNEAKEALLRCYQDLAGDLSKVRVSPESVKERGSAGLLNMTAEKAQLISTLNIEYKNKFQFPFVVCSRENKVNTIISGLQTRRQNSNDVEREKGIEEVKKIAWYRIVDLIPESGITSAKI